MVYSDGCLVASLLVVFQNIIVLQLIILEIFYVVAKTQ